MGGSCWRLTDQRAEQCHVEQKVSPWKRKKETIWCLKNRVRLCDSRLGVKAAQDLLQSHQITKKEVDMG